MASWLDALRRTRAAVMAGMRTRLFGASAPSEAELEQWETALIHADVPARLAGRLTQEVRRRAPGQADSLRDRIAAALLEAVGPTPSFSWTFRGRPGTVLLVGVNGSGKTTTAAKLAHMARRNGLKPLLAAADTFRAAGSDQLEIWGKRVGCDVVSAARGADPAAVAFDALQAAKARGADVLVVDTAGRMHTRQPLMEEMKKIVRAMGKCLPAAPDEIWIVLDASAGNNAMAQVRAFRQAVPLSGAVVAKLDGSSRAGFILGLGGEAGVPVRFTGLGEGVDDLAAFDPRAFVDAMLAAE